jgi:hypothetical protein
MVLYKTAIQRSKQSVPRSERDHEREMGESSTTEKESCADDEETLRITAQSFFGELHLVQRLISSLSVRLRTFGQQDNGKQNMYNGGSVAADDITSLETREEEGGNLPLPVSLLHRLEVDLRRRLRALSGEIVDIIRDG